MYNLFGCIILICLVLNLGFVSCFVSGEKRQEARRLGRTKSKSSNFGVHLEHVLSPANNGAPSKKIFILSSIKHREVNHINNHDHVNVLNSFIHKNNYLKSTKLGKTIELISRTRHDSDVHGESREDKCSFPFIYDGQTVYSCLDVPSKPNRKWCSLTNNYDRDTLWTYCSTQRAASKRIATPHYHKMSRHALAHVITDKNGKGVSLSHISHAHNQVKFHILTAEPRDGIHDSLPDLTSEENFKDERIERLPNTVEPVYRNREAGVQKDTRYHQYPDKGSSDDDNLSETFDKATLGSNDRTNVRMKDRKDYSMGGKKMYYDSPQNGIEIESNSSNGENVVPSKDEPTSQRRKSHKLLRNGGNERIEKDGGKKEQLDEDEKTLINDVSNRIIQTIKNSTRPLEVSKENVKAMSYKTINSGRKPYIIYRVSQGTKNVSNTPDSNIVKSMAKKQRKIISDAKNVNIIIINDRNSNIDLNDIENTISESAGSSDKQEDEGSVNDERINKKTKENLFLLMNAADKGNGSRLGKNKHVMTSHKGKNNMNTQETKDINNPIPIRITDNKNNIEFGGDDTFGSTINYKDKNVSNNSLSSNVNEIKSKENDGAMNSQRPQVTAPDNKNDVDLKESATAVNEQKDLDKNIMELNESDNLVSDSNAKDRQNENDVTNKIDSVTNSAMDSKNTDNTVNILTHDKYEQDVNDGDNTIQLPNQVKDTSNTKNASANFLGSDINYKNETDSSNLISSLSSNENKIPSTENDNAMNSQRPQATVPDTKNELDLSDWVTALKDQTDLDNNKVELGESDNLVSHSNIKDHRNENDSTNKIDSITNSANEKESAQNEIDNSNSMITNTTTDLKSDKTENIVDSTENVGAFTSKDAKDTDNAVSVATNEKNEQDANDDSSTINSESKNQNEGNSNEGGDANNVPGSNDITTGLLPNGNNNNNNMYPHIDDNEKIPLSQMYTIDKNDTDSVTNATSGTDDTSDTTNPSADSSTLHSGSEGVESNDEVDSNEDSDTSILKILNDISSTLNQSTNPIREETYSIGDRNETPRLNPMMPGNVNGTLIPGIRAGQNHNAVNYNVIGPTTNTSAANATNKDATKEQSALAIEEIKVDDNKHVEPSNEKENRNVSFSDLLNEYVNEDYPGKPNDKVLPHNPSFTSKEDTHIALPNLPGQVKSNDAAKPSLESLRTSGRVNMSYAPEEIIIHTFGGNGNGDKCNFPFIYNGQTYFNCINLNREKPWCSTQANYDRVPKWGFCSDDQLLGIQGVRKSGDLKVNEKQQTRKVNKQENLADTIDRLGKELISSNMMTFGGNANGKRCVLPFIYDGEVHTKCIPKVDGSSWCATSHSYDVHPVWGNCCNSEKYKC